MMPQSSWMVQNITLTGDCYYRIAVNSNNWVRKAVTMFIDLSGTGNGFSVIRVFCMPVSSTEKYHRVTYIGGNPSSVLEFYYNFSNNIVSVYVKPIGGSNVNLRASIIGDYIADISEAPSELNLITPMRAE